MDGSEARVATMSEYDVQMASTGSANEAPGDYSKRMRDKKIMLAQYPGPDARWTPSLRGVRMDLLAAMPVLG